MVFAGGTGRGVCVAVRRSCAGVGRAGGLKAANFIYSIAPQDGTVWGFITRGFVRAPLLQTPQADFDPTRFHWIGAPSQETTVAAVWTAGTKVRTMAMLT